MLDEASDRWFMVSQLSLEGLSGLMGKGGAFDRGSLRVAWSRQSTSRDQHDCNHLEHRECRTGLKGTPGKSSNSFAGTVVRMVPLLRSLSFGR